MLKDETSGMQNAMTVSMTDSIQGRCPQHNGIPVRKACSEVHSVAGRLCGQAFTYDEKSWLSRL
jgi:hypothetical protein